tara:strand:- start:332995 stop:333153 length:159 start_codon:yes stop_codon:yes gene_type:complete
LLRIGFSLRDENLASRDEVVHSAGTTPVPADQPRWSLTVIPIGECKGNGVFS